MRWCIQTRLLNINEISNVHQYMNMPHRMLWHNSSPHREVDLYHFPGHIFSLVGGPQHHCQHILIENFSFRFTFFFNCNSCFFFFFYIIDLYSMTICFRLSVVCQNDTDIKQKQFEGSQPEWCISSMIYSRDTPFCSETLELYRNHTQQPCWLAS